MNVSKVATAIADLNKRVTELEARERKRQELDVAAERMAKRLIGGHQPPITGGPEGRTPPRGGSSAAPPDHDHGSEQLPTDMGSRPNPFDVATDEEASDAPEA